MMLLTKYIGCVMYSCVLEGKKCYWLVHFMLSTPYHPQKSNCYTHVQGGILWFWRTSECGYWADHQTFSKEVYDGALINASFYYGLVFLVFSLCPSLCRSHFLFSYLTPCWVCMFFVCHGLDVQTGCVLAGDPSLYVPFICGTNFGFCVQYLG